MSTEIWKRTDQEISVRCMHLVVLAIKRIQIPMNQSRPTALFKRFSISVRSRGSLQWSGSTKKRDSQSNLVPLKIATGWETSTMPTSPVHTRLRIHARRSCKTTCSRASSRSMNYVTRTLRLKLNWCSTIGHQISLKSKLKKLLFCN